MLKPEEKRYCRWDIKLLKQEIVEQEVLSFVMYLPLQLQTFEKDFLQKYWEDLFNYILWVGIIEKQMTALGGKYYALLTLMVPSSSKIWSSRWNLGGTKVKYIPILQNQDGTQSASLNLIG
jgi:hypothetical protein